MDVGKTSIVNYYVFCKVPTAHHFCLVFLLLYFVIVVDFVVEIVAVAVEVLVGIVVVPIK